ncbi:MULTISPECIES: multidrug efflux SMR transporter [Rhizobium/Agrobacterium group]|uniref:DMT family transporter n=1 Tax=Rhizobium/Agrobacterium group TaxID=227290 RepID=UPI000A7A864A|nr:MULTISPECIES: multidrug efflux SMR transporter [Rhizobium/Agrobacterium group]PYG55659.1 quaternary ammonium compound-resistance protein SugE [Rhizobium sp. UGM030330-04]UXT49386.1 multidrug efflux SMR transporter [Agrobacterium tumefaciens]
MKDKANAGRAWLMLLLAGGFEIGYALSVGGSKAFTIPSWSIAAAIFFLLTLYFLSVALKTIDVGLGYAVWAGIGAVGAAVCGSLLLDQPLNLIQTFWLSIIIFGVVWLKLADSTKQSPDQIPSA